MLLFQDKMYCRKSSLAEADFLPGERYFHEFRTLKKAISRPPFLMSEIAQKTPHK